MRYLQIQVKGYKSLADVSLDLHPLTVMIGPNGCGKTSLLEVFQLVREAALGRLRDAIENLGGLESVLTHISGEPSRLEIGFRAEQVSAHFAEPVFYYFVLRPRGSGYVVAAERLNEKDVDGARLISFDADNSGLELSQLSILWNSQSFPYLRDFPLARTLHVSSLSFDVGPRGAIRLPQALTPAIQPGPNGATLFAALYNMRESKALRSSYKRIEETLQLAFPDFDHLELPVVGAGQITLTWHEKHLTIPLYPNQLSEGTLRFLWLTTVLLSPEPPLILIDEPEVSLHPELQKILAALLQDASARTQIIVATHSPELIRWLEPDEVVVIDKLDGKSKFAWANDPSLALEAWLKEYTLADLWYMGNLGGRP